MLPTSRPPTHPGEMLLKECLEPLGVSQVDAAARMNIPFQRLNAIVKGRREVSADTALLLEGLTRSARRSRLLDLPKAPRSREPTVNREPLVGVAKVRQGNTSIGQLNGPASRARISSSRENVDWSQAEAQRSICWRNNSGTAAVVIDPGSGRSPGPSRHPPR